MPAVASNTNQMFYGQRAYEGFARAFASRLGVAVRVTNSGGGAFVDAAGVISLPGMTGYQTAEQFEDTCATIIHEIAHIVYGSNHLFDRQRCAGQARLWMDCLNAVLDVADETAMGYSQDQSGNPRAEQLMIEAAVRAGRQDGLKPNPHNGKPNNAPPHWRILATGIIKARCTGKGIHGIEPFGKWLETEFPAIDIRRAMNILLAARGRPIGKRLSARQLVKLTDLLYKVLETLAPPPGSEQTPMPGGMDKGKGPASPSNQSVPAIPAGGAEATEQDGASVGVFQADATAPAHAGAGAGKGPGESYRALDCDRACYDTMLPIVRRVAARIATDGDAINNEGGYSSGMGVRDAYRIATDGQCMGRWQTDEHADGMAVAILLDCSGSMRPQMAAVAGIAEAFAQGMEECATVRRWQFSDRTKSVETYSRLDPQYGGTSTSDALQAGREWLATQTAGQRIIVCLTDGSPNSSADTQAQVALAVSEGVSVIGVALGDDDVERAIYQSMPQAQIVRAEDVNRLAIGLEGITLQM